MKPSPSNFAGLSLARAGCRTGALALAQEVHRFAHAYQINRSVYIYCSEPAKRMHAWFDGKLKMSTKSELNNFLKCRDSYFLNIVFNFGNITFIRSTLFSKFFLRHAFFKSSL